MAAGGWPSDSLRMSNLQARAVGAGRTGGQDHRLSEVRPTHGGSASDGERQQARSTRPRKTLAPPRKASRRPLIVAVLLIGFFLLASAVGAIWIGMRLLSSDPEPSVAAGEPPAPPASSTPSPPKPKPETQRQLPKPAETKPVETKPAPNKPPTVKPSPDEKPPPVEEKKEIESGGRSTAGTAVRSRGRHQCPSCEGRPGADLSRCRSVKPLSIESRKPRSSRGTSRCEGTAGESIERACRGGRAADGHREMDEGTIAPRGDPGAAAADVRRRLRAQRRGSVVLGIRLDARPRSRVAAGDEANPRARSSIPSRRSRAYRCGFPATKRPTRCPTPSTNWLAFPLLSPSHGQRGLKR